MTGDKMGQTIRTTCGICQIGCGVLASVNDGQVTKVTGDPDHPLNRGTLCPKGFASLEYLYHPQRVRQPMQRTGKRGEGKWQAISWEEATHLIGTNLLNVKRMYGPEAIAFMRGAAKGVQDELLARFANLVGSPNFLSMGYVCFIPRRNASITTYGHFAIPDFDHPPRTIIVWGENTAETLFHVNARILEAHKKGARVIVVDPVKTEDARRAHMWLPVRPGTDLVLALGIIHIILKEGLHDKHFVEQYTTGLEHLMSAVEKYTPEYVALTTSVPADMVRETARIYATEKPGVIQWGNGIDHGINNFQTARAICILRALTGNLGIPGGELEWTEPSILPRGSASFSLHDRIPPDIRQKRLTGNEKLLPNVFYALQHNTLDAMISGKPYPVRAGYIQGSNPLLSYPNGRKTYEAFMGLDFLAVSDMFLTPTAALADVVLPSVMYLEFDSIVAPPYSIPVVSVQQKAARVPDCRSDFEILRDLSRTMGFGDDFWNTEEEYLDMILRPAGISFRELRDFGFMTGMKEYRRFERKGFATPSGKVEIFSERLREWGFDPLPEFREQASTFDPAFPLVLTTKKRGPYRHSGGKQIPSLRRLHPEPVVLINPETGKEFGIEDNLWITIETGLGRITQKAVFDSSISQGTLCADYGWWTPEASPESLYGWQESNINIIINDGPEVGREMGTPQLRGIPCRIRPSSEPIQTI
jgi:anaerobic selenocysteine-containing dehydrogenase